MVGFEVWERWAQSLGELRDWLVGLKGNSLGWAGLESMERGWYPGHCRALLLC